MNTDDLIARARAWARLLPHAWPETKDLITELADEVDRLREGDAWKIGLIDWTRCTCHDGDDPACPEHKEDA